MKLTIKVVPSSSRDAIVGWLGEDLKIKVRAKAKQGKANAAVEKTLAKALGLTQKNVQIVAGLTSSRKTVEFSGIDAARIRELLNALSD